MVFSFLRIPMNLTIKHAIQPNSIDNNNELLLGTYFWSGSMPGPSCTVFHLDVIIP